MASVLAIMQYVLVFLFLFLLSIIVFLFIILLAKQGAKGGSKQTLKVKYLNDEYKEYREVMLSEVLPNKEFKKLLKKEQAELAKNKEKKSQKKKVFVLDFKGDVAAEATEQLREEITAILQIASATDEVVLKLESPGGMVHAYGLAASQLLRIRDKAIPLTVCVDKVAASGGYMMAAVASKIIAAPFAFVGSIGVISSLPNFHKLLEKNDVDYLEMTAGEYKRTVSIFGEVTPSGQAKHQEHLELIHSLFKQHIAAFRPKMDIERVSTGEAWPATKALEFDLVDFLQTSDEYIGECVKSADVYHISLEAKPSLKAKLLKNLFGNGSMPNWKNLFASQFNSDVTKHISI